ncbi:MAG TPA: response regulator [Xanthobacteraceae bacterium]|jgi:PAS domain S-box-containing protein|nr:response regulator [Xanthobacteraceae bacterium]
MAVYDKVNVLLVDDQPAKLLSYEVILQELGENLIKTSSAREAFECLLKNDVAVVLVDVCMPELDGFQLAAMIRDHPRFQKTAIIFISAIHLTDVDRLRGYEMGAVDYVPVPVVPEVLRAKVRVFAELFRKTRQLQQLNLELERRVAERTAELKSSTARLLQSEQLRSLALAAGQMGSWDWDAVSGNFSWDEGQYHIFGVDPKRFSLTPESVRALIHPEDWQRLRAALAGVNEHGQTFQTEFRVCRPNGEMRWCIGAAAASIDANRRVVGLSGVTVDITDRKSAEERQNLLVREVDHRARNALAVVQSIIRLTRAESKEAYIDAVEGRITALSRAHVLLSQSRWQGANLGRILDEELAPYRRSEGDRIVASGPEVFLDPATAQILALTLHELATNAAKYGALSSSSGRVALTWQLGPNHLSMRWTETGGPVVRVPVTEGYGTRVIGASVERQLDGSAIFDWRPEGLSFTMTIPLGEKSSPAGAKPDARAPHDDAATPRRGLALGNRLLLVEDEALTGMMMSDMLTDLGFEVIGPFARVADALAAAGREDFQAAVLDVNLDGEMVYPVAEAILARGVPFVFVTGYGAEGIDRRFAQIPVLQKPIERQMLQSAFVNSARRAPESVGG